MKCTVFFLLATCLQVSAKGYSQDRITLNLHAADVKTVLSTIEKTSSFRFLYNQMLVSHLGKVDIIANNELVTTVLDRVFENKGISYELLANNLIVLKTGDASVTEVPVTGHVVSPTGEPLAGVSITIKGSTFGTSTDANGNFSITVPDGATLEFSSVGFATQEIKVTGPTPLNVKMAQAVSNSMDEVVVVGYGVQRKIDVTGSVGHVKGEELAKQPVLTATQALQGKMAGVQVISSGQPGSLPQVIIRGTGSMLAGVNPLYIVDGVWSDDITNINTADIASIDILKDASACSIYGVRGANGVILITTKQGSGKIKINYTTNIGVQQASNLVKMANAQEYVDYLQATTGLPVHPTDYSTDWYSKILRTAFYQNHSLSISGSTAQNKYALSVGYQDNQGIIINNKYTRYTARFNNEFTPASFIKIGTTASFAHQAAQNVPAGTITEQAYRASPLVPDVINGKFGNTSQYQNVGNPVLTAQSIDDRSLSNRIQGNIYVEIKPIRSISVRSTFNDEINIYDDRQYTYQQPNDTSFFNVNGGSQGASRSELSLSNAKYYHWVWSNTINYNKEFGRSNINVMVGTESQTYYATSFTAARYNVPAVKSEWYLQNGDQATETNGSSVSKYATNSYFGRVVYNYDDRFLFTGNFRADGSSVFATANRWGYFPGVSAGWVISKENFMRSQHIFQYLKLKASWGELGNSNIPGDASILTTISNLPYFFNSGSSGTGGTNGTITPQIKDVNVKWETTKEEDIGLEFTILNGKLSGEFDVYDKRATNALIFKQVPGTFGSQANPSSTIAAGYLLTNAASIDNKGLELSARWHDNINKNLSYFIGGNVSMNKNKVLSLNGGVPFFDGNINGYYTTETKAGYPIGAFFMRQVTGVFQSQNEIDNYRDKNGNLLQAGAQPGDFIYKYNDNGKLDTAYQGAYQPKLYVGLSGGLNYKAIDFSIDIYSNIGNQVYNGKEQARVVYTDNIERSAATSYWSPGNPSQTQPRANAGNLPSSSYFISSGTFARINNVTLGYTLPEKILSRQNAIHSCRIYLIAQNPVTIKKFSGFSAELPSAATVYNGSALTANTLIPISTATNAGIEFNTYPTIKTFAVGLNIGF